MFIHWFLFRCNYPLFILHIYAANNELKSTGAEMIAGLLSVNSTLTVLDIACNGIDSDYDIFTLVDGIRYLSNCFCGYLYRYGQIESIKNIHVIAHWFSFFVLVMDNLFRRNRSKCKLKELYLEENKFGISGCRVITTKDNNNNTTMRMITIIIM